MALKDFKFPLEVVADLIRRGVVRTPSSYKRPKQEAVWLYLVRAEVNDIPFQKIGLSAENDPMQRDPKAYKKLIHAIQVPTSKAAAIEAVALGLCTNRHSDGDHRLWREELGDWAGASEAVFAEEPVTASFIEAAELCAELSYEEISDELTRCWHLQNRVFNVYSDPQRLAADTKHFRQVLGVETWEARNEWDNSRGWNFTPC